MVRALQEEFALSRTTCTILVVDDNSPDRTADAVRAEARSLQNLHLNHRMKAGLGARIHPRYEATPSSSCRPTRSWKMDADFSHKPEDVAAAHRGLDHGADFVIGKQVCPEEDPGRLELFPQMNSKWERIRPLCGRDLPGQGLHGGFRAIRASIINKIDLDELKVKGYAFQISLLHEAVMNHAVVREIPVEFVDRKRGETKLGLVRHRRVHS